MKNLEASLNEQKGSAYKFNGTDAQKNFMETHDTFTCDALVCNSSYNASAEEFCNDCSANAGTFDATTVDATDPCACLDASHMMFNHYCWAVERKDTGVKCERDELWFYN
jgi:hypothetical protein